MPPESAGWPRTRAKGGGEPALVLADSTKFILGNGTALGQLAICVLGVIPITNEYSTGVIRASLLAVAGRTSMLIAKAAVFAGALVVLAEAISSATTSGGSQRPTWASLVEAVTSTGTASGAGTSTLPPRGQSCERARRRTAHAQGAASRSTSHTTRSARMRAAGRSAPSRSAPSASALCAPLTVTSTSRARSIPA